MARILFATQQDEIVKELEKSLLSGHWIDIAKSVTSAKHFLRGNTCDYSLIFIDASLDSGNGPSLMKFIYEKFPEAHIVGISEKLASWPAMPGKFSHVERYHNSNTHHNAWRRPHIEAVTSQLAK